MSDLSFSEQERLKQLERELEQRLQPLGSREHPLRLRGKVPSELGLRLGGVHW